MNRNQHFQEIIERLAATCQSQPVEYRAGWLRSELDRKLSKINPDLSDRVFDRMKHLDSCGDCEAILNYLRTIDIDEQPSLWDYSALVLAVAAGGCLSLLFLAYFLSQ